MTLAMLGLPPITFRKAVNYTLGRNEPVRAFVNHRMVGTLVGTDAYFTNPATRNVSTHFGVGVRDGKVVISQYVPLDDTAYGNGNYDSSGNWDNWGFKVTNINAQTISIEHQDHDGNTLNKGVVSEAIQQASMKLQALIRYGSLSQWKAAGIIVRDYSNNGPILQREIRAIPVEGKRIITHNDISGRLKPYCWKPWSADLVGFPRAKYVTGIANYGTVLMAPEPALPPPPEPKFTQTDLDNAFRAGAESRNPEIAALKVQIGEVQTLLDTAAMRIIKAKDALDG